MRASCLGVLLLVATATAQTAHLAGLTTTGLLFHRSHSSCSMLAQCPVPGLTPTTVPTLGGSGWDPVLQGLWISDGYQIACVDDNCNFLCNPAPVPTPGQITGLEVVESLNEIWATDTLGNLVRMTRSCPPTMLSACNTGVVSSFTQGLTGLAVDEGRQLIFYSEGDFATGTTIVHVAKFNTPCAPLVSTNFAVYTAVICPPGYFRVCTGLAVDWRFGELYLTDGLHTLYIYYVHPAPNLFSWGLASCCVMFPNDTLIGLAWRPALPVPLGGPCANGTCASCAMVHDLQGDPDLGNGQFALRLKGGATGSLVWFLLTIGQCNAPGATLPGFCGPLFTTNTVLATLGPAVVTGPSPCGTPLLWPLPLPANVALASMPIASQVGGLCAGAGLNTTLSNCLSWVLQAN